MKTIDLKRYYPNPELYEASNMVDVSDEVANVMEQSLLSIITSISFDHMEVLGNTLAAIAEKKAGIIKEGGMVLSSQQASEVDSVLEKTCQAKEASLEKMVMPRSLSCWSKSNKVSLWSTRPKCRMALAW